MTATLHHGSCLDLFPGILNGKEINCVITDPPYGADFVSRRAVTPAGKRWVEEVAGDSSLDDAITLFDNAMDRVLPHVSDPGELYVFTRWDIVDTWIRVVRDLDRHGFAYKMMLVWDKGIPGMGDIDCNWGCGHELILYCKKGRREVPYRRSSIIAVDKVHTTAHIHPTEKPVALLEKLVEMSTKPGDLVVDPFAGSGSTLVAAQNLGRCAIGTELAERYIEPARRRLGQTTLLSELLEGEEPF